MPRELFIAEWQWDDNNLRHLAERHPELARRPRRIVRQVWQTEPRYRQNKAGRAATHQMIGPDYGGSMWTFCIMEVFTDQGLWRVVTGWAAEQPEIQWYRRQMVSKHKQSQPEEDLAADLYEHRNDEGEWGDEAVPIKAKPSRTEVVSVRIPSSDLDLIEDLAEQAGESISDFIRGAIALRLRGQVMDPVVGFASGAGSDSTVLVRTILKAAGHTALPSHEEFQLDVEVPDEPPPTVTIMR